ncbi:hypothetical protein TWF694_000572 [Orbilia ellipsospora]|uniref:Autophagy-related protein 17 n=1 Tax=Orbilia ellipsospora TaxID=2528407 RepID=A0AAV9XPC3_9PEZI
MDPAVALQTLLDCLREHGALITRADIEWAFATEKNVTQISSFIQNYLNTNTLLSHEEKEIYESLKSKDLLSAEPPPLSSQPTTDEQLSDDLAALELQNELLKQNIARLTRLKSEHEVKSNIERKHQTSLVQNREQLLQMYMSERDQNAAAIDDLEITFRACLSDLQDASGKLNFTMSAMSEATRNDDRLLARLQTMISDILLATESSGEEAISAASEYADMLAMLEEQIIKTRVDRTFLESVGKATTAVGESEEMEGQPFLDVQEFNELMEEVEVVASMRAKEGLLQPILAHLTSDEKSKMGSMAQRCSYILSALSLLDSRNREAEAEFTNRNNMQYVSGRMKMLFDLSLRDFHDAMQNPAAKAMAKISQPPGAPADDKTSYLESKLWRSLGVSSFGSEGGPGVEIAGGTAKLGTKEELYKQLWATHMKNIQEVGGVVDGLGHTVGDSEGGTVGSDLNAVEGKVKNISVEVGQLASLANGRDTSKMAVISNLKEKETYGR